MATWQRELVAKFKVLFLREPPRGGSLLDQVPSLLYVYKGMSRNMLAPMWGQDLRGKFDIIGKVKQGPQRYRNISRLSPESPDKSAKCHYKLSPFCCTGGPGEAASFSDLMTTPENFGKARSLPTSSPGHASARAILRQWESANSAQKQPGDFARNLLNAGGLKSASVHFQSRESVQSNHSSRHTSPLVSMSVCPWESRRRTTRPNSIT
jgi:hypothetical protein